MSHPDPGSSAREPAGGTGAHAAAAAGFKGGSSFTMAASGASSTSALPVTVQSPSHGAGMTAAAGMTASTGPAGSLESLPMYSTSTGDAAAASGSRGTSSAGDPSALRLSSYNPWTPQVCECVRPVLFARLCVHSAHPFSISHCTHVSGCLHGGRWIAVLTTTNDLQEDEKLRDLVAKHGAQNWSVIAKNLPGRNGKSCRCAQLLCASNTIILNAAASTPSLVNTPPVQPHTNTTITAWQPVLCTRVQHAWPSLEPAHCLCCCRLCVCLSVCNTLQAPLGEPAAGRHQD